MTCSQWHQSQWHLLYIIFVNLLANFYGLFCISPGMLMDYLLGLLFLRYHLYFKQQISHFKQRTSVCDWETAKSIVARCVTKDRYTQ